jgi:DNA replication protein DnaC
MPTCADFRLSKDVANDPKFRAMWFHMDEYCAEILEMCQRVELWTKRCLTNDPGRKLIILAGRVGTGKTTLARRAIRAISKTNISAWYENFIPQPLKTDHFKWGAVANLGPAARNEGSRWIDAVEAHAALIDDIGTETDQFNAGVATENLRLLLEARKNLWTIITTNIPPQKWAKAWDFRVEDRLQRNSDIVEILAAPSYTRNPQPVSA